MSPKYKNVLINSTLAFIAAFLITTILHELGHYLAYLIYEANPTLFHTFVQTPAIFLTTGERIFSALAGPLASLLQALLFGIVVSRGPKNSVSYLLFLWLSLLGFVNFFGYLVMTPFSAKGDTGKIAELLGLSQPSKVVIALLGFALLVWLIRKMARIFSIFIPARLEEKQRSKYIYHLMFFPIMIGSLLNTGLAFPVVAVMSIVYPATSAYVIMSSFPVILRTPSFKLTLPGIDEKIVIGLGLLTLFTIILNRLLTLGWG
ncbi:MAG: hypothetical protein HQ508_03425 [Candidatus Marinimicrobia bacterium]|nr:hypothetical protein [Candidatus Neomarinimicrobiota bacterium]